MGRLPTLGEFSTPEILGEALQPLFLQTVSRVAPAVLASLREDVLPIYQRSWETADVEAEKLRPSRPRPPAPVWDETTVRAGTYKRVSYPTHPERGRPLFDKEEAAALHGEGYELMGATDDPGYYIYEPRHARPLDPRTPHRYLVDFDDLSYYPALADLQSALLAWAERFHLKAEWVLDGALGQLDHWDRHFHLRCPLCRWPIDKNLQTTSQATLQADAENKGSRETPPAQGADIIGPQYFTWDAIPSFGWYSPLADEEYRLLFEHPGWDPAMGTREAARTYILADFGRALSAYLDRMEKSITADREAWARTRSQGALSRHLEWLVRYQCLGQEVRDLAETEHASRDTIRKPIKELADVLGLKLRRGRPGRPSGAKDKRQRPSRRPH